MRILAVDTATQICGVALADDGATQVALSLDTGQTHTRTIMDAIASVLRFGGIDLSAVDGFTVTRGPGSFTGLRIGISTVKGLAVATGKPMVGISTLEVLANQIELNSGLICPMLDARRGEVYWMHYRRQKDDLAVAQPEQVGRAAEATKPISEPCTFIGNGALVYRSEIAGLLKTSGHWVSEHGSRICPATLARLGQHRFEAGKIDDPASFGPVYLRKSDAEINFSSKSSH